MKCLFILIVCCLPMGLWAQTIVSGTVVDKKGAPIIGANVGIVGSYDGGTANAKGEYSFETSETGIQKLSVQFIGFEKQEIEINIESANISQNFILREKISKLKAVRITAGAFEASDEKQGTSLSSLDMVTTAGSNGDITGALKTLPGTQQTNDREGLFVRGGTGNETQTYIDGTRVRNAFTTGIPDLGARGRFSPFIFKGTIFSAGGYSALYGQALSSALILSTIDLPQKSSANLSLSSVGIGGGYQHLSKSKKQSWGINYNHTNLGAYFQLIKQNIDFTQAPVANQVDANYRAKIGKTGMLKFYGYLTNTNTGIRRQNITSLDYYDDTKLYKDEYNLKNGNGYANLSYKTFVDKNWVMNIGYCISKNNDNIGTRILTQENELIKDSNFSSNNLQIKSSSFFTSSKVVLDREFKNLSAIRFGAEYVYQKEDLITSTYTGLGAVAFKDHYKALFAETDLYLTNDIALKLGVRAEHTSVLDKINIAPRASVAYKIDNGGQFSAAYGMFYQNPDVPYLYTYYNVPSSLNYQRADHYILNYLYEKKGRLLRLEVYDKEYHNLIKTTGTYGQNTNSTGRGYARGFELFYRDKTTLKGIDYWISYSFIDSKRDYLDFPEMVQPSFVANHVASLVFKKFWTKKMFGINGTYTYSSGRPYNDLNVDGFMTGRTIDYHTVGVSLNYIKTIKKKIFTVFVLSVNNPFNFKQVYGYNYAQQDLNGDGQFARSEILPTARQFIFLGMFSSWGIDRSQEAINNNL